MVFDENSGVESSRPSRQPVEKGNSAAITGVMRISLSKIYEAITQLAKVSNKKLEELNDLESSLLTSIMNAVRTRNSNTNNIMSKIRQEFADKKPLIPGTVGAQLAGCVHNDAFLIPECSAVCGGSALPDTVGMSECMYNVIHYRSDGSIVLYHKNASSDHAILHVLADNFQGITAEQLKSIEEDGIKYVNINKPGSDFDVSSGFLPLAKLPIVGSRPHHTNVPTSVAAATKHHNEKPPPPPPQPVYPSTWNWLTITGLILLGILLILLLWFIFSSVGRNRRAAEQASLVTATSPESDSELYYMGRSSVADAML